MAYDAGDLVIVPFPFSDMGLAKSRPALVLSPAMDSTATGASVMAMVTSAASSAWPRDVTLADWSSYGLRGACIVRAKLFTLDNRIVTRRMAALSDSDRSAIRQAFSGLIAI